MEVIKKSKASKVSKSAQKVSQAPIAHGVGRRKSSVARVWVRRGGTGKLVVNGKDYVDYFDTEINRIQATKPFHVIAASDHYDFTADVSGGGVCSQAGAVKLGISRALVSLDEAARIPLRKECLLTVDSRLKERKKYGRKAARRRFQFVKR